jgi:hypothetical protein
VPAIAACVGDALRNLIQRTIHELQNSVQLDQAINQARLHYGQHLAENGDLAVDSLAEFAQAICK